MIENQHAALANFRMEKAAHNLRVARQNYQLGQFEEAVSKSYYSILTAMRALNALHHRDSHRHEGVITLFHELFVKPRVFPKDFNRTIRKLKGLREDADYGDFVEVSKEQAEGAIEEAEKFLKRADEVLVNMLTAKDKK
jgi:uncharacterized protein (UPF0332 family)